MGFVWLRATGAFLRDVGGTNRSRIAIGTPQGGLNNITQGRRPPKVVVHLVERVCQKNVVLGQTDLMPLRAYGKGPRETHIPWSVHQQMVMITMNRVGEEGSQLQSVEEAVAFLRKSLGPANTLFKIFGSCEQATRRHVHINMCAPNRITWVKLRKKLAASKRFPGHFNVWEASAAKDMADRWAYACKYLNDPTKKKELGALLPEVETRSGAELNAASKRELKAMIKWKYFQWHAAQGVPLHLVERAWLMTAYA